MDERLKFVAGLLDGEKIAADAVDAVERGHDISCTVDPGHCSGARYECAAKHRSRHRAF
jgi:hypothetical protein